MSTPSMNTMLLNSEHEKKRFREEHYGTVYAYAFDATGSDDQARELAERTFADLECRHENQPVAIHCDSYLAAQVYLMYAKGDIAIPAEKPPASVFSTAPSSTEETRDTAFAAASKPAEDDRIRQETDTLKEPQPDVVEKEQTLQAADTAAAKDLPPISQPPDKNKTQTLSDNSLSISSLDDAKGKDAVYDDANTIFWIPGLKPQECAAQAVIKKPMLEKPAGRSAFLSIINGILVLCSLAAISFLLMQLDLIPALF